MKSLLALPLALALATACGSRGDGPAAGGASACTSANATEALECDVVDLVNARRSEGATCAGTPVGASPALSTHSTLRSVARAHAEDMAKRGFFDHTNPDGLDPFDRMTQAGYAFAAAGENIAQGAPDAASAMALWMQSEGHCKNIMDPGFEEIGVGYAADGHLWVQVFGSRR